MIIAMIVASSEDRAGTYNPDTAAVNGTAYNLTIFYLMNTVYLIMSIAKFGAAKWSLELFGVHSPDILNTLSE